MSLRYTVTTYTCPNCGNIIKRESDASGYLLVVFIPLLLLVLPFYLSYSILNKFFFKVEEIPRVSNTTEIKKIPKTITCRNCKKEFLLKTRYSVSIKYDDLDDDEKKTYDNRWWFRVAYILGGFCACCIPCSFSLCSSHPTDQLIGTIFLCLIPVFLLPVVGIVWRWKKVSQGKKQVLKAKKGLSVTDELREYKKLLDEGVITQEEFEQKKKELL